ncbi:MAG TPA: cytoplasmic protein [Desulfobacteraceae bacterium]|nr:cytoplasmic protein [Desulfobacteraceae bacterium]
MARDSHWFVETYKGLVGFGFDRETNGYTLTYYVQKFSDDSVMEILRERMSDEDMERLFTLLSGLIRKYLTDDEYHRLFLRD